MGDSTEHDVATLEFVIPIWINPPAKEKRERIIKNIVTRIFESKDTWDYDDGGIKTQLNLTSDNLKLEVSRRGSVYSGRLLKFSGEFDSSITWESKMKEFGTIVPNRTAIKLRTSDDLDDNSGDIYGVVTGIDQFDASLINFTIDTDTLPQAIHNGPVTEIIDPTRKYPGNGINITNTANVHRYMIIGFDDSDDDLITAHNQHWGGLEADNNDIIEYVGGEWVIIFDASNSSPNQYMWSLSDGNHYRFDGADWVYTVLGVYNPVYWSIQDIQIH